MATLKVSVVLSVYLWGWFKKNRHTCIWLHYKHSSYYLYIFPTCYKIIIKKLKIGIYLNDKVHNLSSYIILYSLIQHEIENSDEIFKNVITAVFDYKMIIYFFSVIWLFFFIFLIIIFTAGCRYRNIIMIHNIYFKNSVNE